jgi:hypothetical protein
MVTELDRSASNTVSRNGPVPVVHGLVSAWVASLAAPWGGPLDVGDKNDQHKIGEDADGNAINPVHISTDALYLMRDVQQAPPRDGPIHFERGEYPGNIQRGPSKVPVHIVFDRNSLAPGPGASASFGRWAAYAESLIDDDAPYEPPPPPPTAPPPPTTPTPPTTPPTTTPPTTPPVTTPPTTPWEEPWRRGDGGNPDGGAGVGVVPLPFSKRPDSLSGAVGVGGINDLRNALQPSKPYVGPTVITTPRPLAQMHRELAVPALAIKPHSFGCGRPDLRNDQQGDEEAMERHRREDPVVARIEGAWAKVGPDCNAGVPTYTNRPGNARYVGGTASGVLAFLPPEVGMEDAATGFAPPGIEVSTVNLVALKGKVQFASGLPDPTGGTVKSGWKWGARTSDDKFALVSTTSAGADDKTVTIPNRDLTMVGRAASGTNQKFLRFDANGDAQDAGASDDGTTITLHGGQLECDAIVFRIRPANNNTPVGLYMRGSNAASGDNNGGPVDIRAGAKSGTGTDGTLALSTGAGVAKFTINADGTVTQAGDHTFTGTLTATGATTTGDTRVVSVSLAYPTVDPGGGYAVTVTEGVVFVDSSTLAGTDNFDVELPAASGSSNRRVSVKITAVGAGSSTITVKSAGGTVEGAAASTGVPMDATARSKVTYQSDGAAWWSV